MKSFIKDGVICLVEKDINEPLEHFSERGNFIVSQNPTNKEDYTKAVRFSRLFVNCKYYKCQYSPEVMKSLKLMTAKL